ncbi:hypothetical protein AVEN_196199-1 [Araneus ventricosus]|uniref:Acid-sensing ion channel 1 n=1 Tax=Araneus ventricosus TaxID=182803 RepID=A0A4Y2F344_ARAVE|nr:hypothetical protein AVEN_78719-1 [Araneus ventricosus]GBM34996.1 hypothetical protein AVEN_196199-1 [Araneus ventricosus]
MFMVACLVGSIYNIQKYCYFYWQYPVVVNFQIEQTRSLEFPAVTVCNLNRISSINYRTGKDDGITGTPLMYSESRGLYNCQNRSDGKDEENQMILNFLMIYYGLDEVKRFKLG